MGGQEGAGDARGGIQIGREGRDGWSCGGGGEGVQSGGEGGGGGGTCAGMGGR